MKSLLHFSEWITEGAEYHLGLDAVLCSVVWLFATPECNHQLPLSTGFPMQEYWSGLSFPSPRGLSNPGIEPTFDLTQSHGLDSVYLKGNGLLKQSMMSLGEYLIWKGWYSTMLKRKVFFCVFFPHNILTLGFATKTSNVRYEGNLSKHYNLLKSHFMWKAIFCVPSVDCTCGWCLTVQKKT